MHVIERLELLYLIQELKHLEGKRLDKVYTLKNGTLKFKFGQLFLFVNRGQYAFFMDASQTNKEAIGEHMPSAFSTYKEDKVSEKLRKELRNHRLERISLLEGDRVLELLFSGYALWFDMYGKGSVALFETDREASANHNGKAGEAREKEEAVTKYKKALFESGKPIHAENINDVRQLFETYAEKPLGAVLVKLVGKKYKDVMLKKLGFEERQASGAFVDRIGQIEAEIEELLARAKPYLTADKHDYGLYFDERPSAAKDMPSLSAALAEVELNLPTPSESKDAIEKQRRIVEIQKSKISEYEEKAALYKHIGQLLFQSASAVDTFLESLRKWLEKKGKTEGEKPAGFLLSLDGTTYSIQGLDEKNKKVLLRKVKEQE